MNERTSQIIGLLGFIIAGFLFIAVGVKSGDMLTVIASVIWTLSCIIWMIPILRGGEDE